MQFAPFSPKYFKRRVFGQLWMLALQFVLGMLLNVMGSDAGGTQHTLYVVILIAHIINAIGLVEGGLFIALKERSKLAWYAALAVTITFFSGVLTARTGSDAWSLVMAIGFLISSWLYVMLYLKADRQLRSVK